MKCGYLGPVGSYSYLALKESFPAYEPVSRDTFAEIIEQVESGDLTAGFLPVENSTEGAVTSVMDSLLSLSRATILGETVYTVKHHLFSAVKEMESIDRVYSHPQALEQCRHFFRNQYPKIRLIPVESTSAACVRAFHEGRGAGAVTSQWGGLHHGLLSVLENIQDNRFNQTRFVLLGEGNCQPTGDDKTAIAFSFHRDYAGSLYEVLKIFADVSINLTRIESRPAKMELGHYVFFIDFEGHQQDEVVKRVLEKLQLMTRRFHVFGSFPKAKGPVGS